MHLICFFVTLCLISFINTRLDNKMKLKLIIGSIAVVLLLSLMFLGPRDELTVRSFLMHCVMPTIAVVVFWINYLWLMPKFAIQGNKRNVIIYNIIIIVCSCTFLTYWHNIEWQYTRKNTHFEAMEKQMGEQRPEEQGPEEQGLEGQGPGEQGIEGQGPEGQGPEGQGKHIEEREFNDNPFHDEEVGPADRQHTLEPRKDFRRAHDIHKLRRDNNINILASLRDSINFAFAIFVAYAIRSQQHISRLRQKRQEAEVARRDAELRSLRNQISPHFLLNTLNNIYALAAIDSERTQSAVMQLSKMLRHMLYDNQSEMVTLRSEIEFIRSYVDLMRLRQAQNVKVETLFDIKEDSDTMVAPLLFISLIENAFKHGVSSSEPCLISIKMSENNDGIICDISNSNHPKHSNDRSGHGVGLELVQQRLDMVYPDKYSWIKGVGADGLYHSVIQLRNT